jgi:hypothetical protein
MNLSCVPQKVSKLFLAMIFTLLGLGTAVIGAIVVPFFGLLFAIPFFGFAYYFYRSHLTNQCQLP